MIKFLRNLQSIIRDDRGLVGGTGILASITTYSMGILCFSLLAFSGRQPWPISQTGLSITSIANYESLLKAVGDGIVDGKLGVCRSRNLKETLQVLGKLPGIPGSIPTSFR
ncbi:hypothetical protein Y981_03485 [Leptospirillum ferriphilum YSK]|uniref:Uncharacterized protein n=1 Tax=Leptospirillum ferriphilum YSK TaxID=1441628 RepID=A0A059XWQ2_9BACT|nr:hypothetical protein Y981_03485 [Leptospirillum ferriphilum YSK]